MPIPTGNNTRTIAGYVKVLLDYPRWVFEREVDFTNCLYSGRYESSDDRCTTCHFGAACRWLNLRQPAPTASDPLPELLSALDAAVVYLRSPDRENAAHDRHCRCETCTWLHNAKSFLRQHHHH